MLFPCQFRLGRHHLFGKTGAHFQATGKGQGGHLFLLSGQLVLPFLQFLRLPGQCSGEGLLRLEGPFPGGICAGKKFCRPLTVTVQFEEAAFEMIGDLLDPLAA